ncbi:MAG: hypothetical protein R6T99_02510 [Bacteroidales bacterium]
MEELIYILLGVLWLVFTFYSQGKKKKQREAARSVQTDHSEPSSASDTLFDDFFGDQESDLVPGEFQKVEDAAEQRLREAQKAIKEGFEDEHEKLKIQSVEKRGKKYFSEERLKEFFDNIKDDSKLEEPQPSIRDFMDQDDEGNLHIDLRKAIVYQAILERPYA